MEFNIKCFKEWTSNNNNMQHHANIMWGPFSWVHIIPTQNIADNI